MQFCCEWRAIVLDTPEHNVDESRAKLCRFSMFMAVSNDCLGCAYWLMETRGAAVCARQEYDRTPLHRLLVRYPNMSEKQQRQWKPIVKLMCDQSKDSEFAPLHQTISMTHVPLTKLLLDCGAQLSSVVDLKIPKWANDLASGRESCHKAVITFIGIRRFGRSRVMQNTVRDVVALIAKELWSTRFLGNWIPHFTKPQPKRVKLSKKK